MTRFVDRANDVERNRRWSVGVAVAVACSVTGVGCLSASTGVFDAAGYRSSYGYSVAYESGAQQLLPEAWRLDNFVRQQDGWVRKPWDRLTDYYVDDDDLGAFIQGYTYSVRYEHRVHAGVIWLRDIPISPKLRSRDLRVLMQSNIAAITKATYEAVEGGKSSSGGATPRIVIEHWPAAAVLDEGPAVVAGQPAYAATLEIDDVHVTPQRIQLVLLRAPRDETYQPARSTAPERHYPMLVLAAYSNLPTDFAKGLDDFHGLLRRLAIDGKTGLALPEAQQAPRSLPPPRLPVI